jgi:hypothetical protein
MIRFMDAASDQVKVAVLAAAGNAATSAIAGCCRRARSTSRPDPEPTNLDLQVTPADKFDRAVRSITSDIAGAIYAIQFVVVNGF